MCNTDCTTTIHIRLECQNLKNNHLLEINIRFTYNHVINLAASLNFWQVKDKVCEEFLNLFRNGHSFSLAIYAHEDQLHINITDEQELLEILADWANNLNYDYVYHLFDKYHKDALGSFNGKVMFERLTLIVKDYNNSSQRKAVLQEYDAYNGKVFILCIVTGLMYRVHKKILQVRELCYLNTSVSFEPLNTLVTLFYTSCAVKTFYSDFSSSQTRWKLL